MIIRNQTTATGDARAQAIELSSTGVTRQVKRPKATFGSISSTSVASYFGVFLLVVSMIAIGYHPPARSEAVTSVNAVANNSASTTNTSTEATVDQLMATNVAASIAESADMPISNNVANLSQSLAVESTLAQTDTNVISKPQIVQPAADSRISQTYTAVAGDTVQSVAQKYGVSVTTIKWANKLTSDALDPGKVLTIPPVDGVVYTVRAGDTIDTIAAKYKADRDRLIAFNDLELSGNPAAGSQIIIPGGDLPTNERPGYVAPRAAVTSYGNYGGGYGSSYGGGASVGNRYAWGNCTWYAYERRLQLGMPVGGMWGNANTWAYAAAASGYRVDGNPTPGAVMQNGGGYGHVAVVESINPGVSITISEMNGYRFGGGFARVGHGDISWGEAVSGMYRYIH
jgi:surface antigen/LysM repeat protein